MINRRRTLGGLLAATAALPSPRLARAQAFPNRPLRLIAPYPPGGGIDSVARLLAAPRPLWLLDEQLAPLDSVWRGRLGELMAAHVAGGGMILAAVHDPLPMPSRGVEVGA